MQTIYRLNVFHFTLASLVRTHPYNLKGFPACHLTKYHLGWNQILIMLHCGVSLVNIWAVTSVLLRVHPHFLAEVILFGSEVTNDLSHVCIHIVEEKLGGGPLGRISMDPAVAIRHVLPDL